MKGKDDKFSIGEGRDIDQNIKKLQKELGDLQLNGAPDIIEEEIERRRKTKKTQTRQKIKIEKKEVKEIKPPPAAAQKYTPIIEEKRPLRERFGIFKNTKFYITVFGITAAAFVLIKAPVFKYTTPARNDSDFYGIDVGFKYYNNIFGQQTRSKTIVYVGQEKIEMPISMEHWYSLSKEKKFLAIDYYRNK
ncbi:MAG: hypothetical protein GX554_02410 [Elusimicrobia bacterium]|nr:hypothetical protein [Elusimicrobiota bacterium]